MFPRIVRTLALLAVVAGSAPVASAGPPLICHPFVTDAAAPLLPWAPSGDWYAPARGYEIADVKADTLKLLSPDASLLARMENMRRAAIYADRDPVVAGALLGAVLARTKSPPADPQAAALAWFDAGYLVETYRQLDLVYLHGMREGKGRVSLLPAEAARLDGYRLVQKALAIMPQAQPEMEFAASLMADNALAAAHRTRAATGIAADPLLAANLSMFTAQ